MKSLWKQLDLRIQIVFTLLVLSFFYAFWQHFTSDILPIHECRKSDSLTQAIQYMRGAAFLEPQTNWISPSGNRNAAAEFPIIYYLLGQIWKLTGYQLWISKLLSLTILITAIASLHRVLFWFFGTKQKVLVFSAIIYSAPVLVYYSDTVLPNVYSFAFFLLGTSACFAYIQNRNWKNYVVFSLFLALALLIKITALIAVLAFAGAFFFHCLFSNNWKKYLHDARVYWLLFSGVLSLLLCFLWYAYAIRYNTAHNSTIFSTTIRPIWEVSSDEQMRIIKLVLTEHVKELYHQLILIPLVLLGFWSLLKKEIPSFLRWFIVISFLGLISYFILWFWVFDVHDYYLIEVLFVPLMLAAIYMKYGALFIRSAQWRKRVSMLGLALVFLNTVSYTQVAAGHQNIIVKNTPLTSSFIRGNWGWFYFNQGETLGQIQDQKKALQKIIAPTDTVFCFSDPYPNVHLTAIDRIGYSNYSLYRDKPFVGQIQTLIQKGASKLLVLKQDTSHVDIKSFMKHKVYEQGNVLLYDLKPLRQ
ncbi:MAG: ArnT family glycosyltransferase [Flavobacteriales bacterium]